MNKDKEKKPGKVNILQQTKNVGKYIKLSALFIHSFNKHLLSLVIFICHYAVDSPREVISTGLGRMRPEWEFEKLCYYNMQVRVKDHGLISKLCIGKNCDGKEKGRVGKTHAEIQCLFYHVT